MKPNASMLLGKALQHVPIEIKLLTPLAVLPEYMTAGSAGMDVCAAIEKPFVLEPFAIGLLPTGLAIELPEGFEGQVRPRSGLAVKHGVTVLNAPGTIDWDYRGEIKVALVNMGPEDFVVQPKMRIAQLVIAPVSQAVLNVVTELDDTKRGSGGFGHTGVGV
jgi:dUTP pyrophosphatase